MSLVQPRVVIGVGVIALVVGIVALLNGYTTFAPMSLFLSIAATILAAILITTPDVPSVEQLEARRTAATQPASSTDHVQDEA